MEVMLTAEAEAEAGAYGYFNKENYEGRVQYRLLGDDDPLKGAAEAVAVAAWRALGCRDGGRVDLRCDAAGRPQFLEVNPLAGLRPGYSDLPILAEKAGISYRELLGAMVTSALARLRAGAEAAV
jgi:D-alanine-D-alanine ligase